MKEATGELNMTVITVVAIAAVAALFYTLVWPAIQKAIVNNTCATLGSGWQAVNKNEAVDAGNISANTAKDVKWVCCDKDKKNCTLAN
mgnify:CR=1 FL=1